MKKFGFFRGALILSRSFGNSFRQCTSFVKPYVVQASKGNLFSSDQFRIPKRQEKTNLELLNTHPQDEALQFDELNHVYSYNGIKMPISVTTLIDSCFPKFDPDEIIPKMMQSSNWPRPGMHNQ